MGRVLCKFWGTDQHFYYRHKQENEPVVSQYQIHTHTFYELLFYIKGDVRFIAEGSVYQVFPMDMLVTRPGEMHQIYCHSPSPYERIILTLTDTFFSQNDCMAYRSIFTDREPGTENLLRASEEKRNEIMDAFQRIERYVTEENPNEVVIRCAVIELLHLLNQLKPERKTGAPQSIAVQKAAAYINRNLTGSLSLDLLAEKFFVSKYYLCRMFKKYTGMTIGRYITRKRILLAKDLYQKGCSLSEAAAGSGFSDYSAFYKACLKETGKPPHNALE